MEQQGIDALLLAPSSDLFYLSGIRKQPSGRFTCLIVVPDGVHYLAPAFELPSLPRAVLEYTECHGFADTDDPCRMAELLLGRGTVAVGDGVPAGMLLPLMERLGGRCRFVSAKELMQRLRAVKSEAEYLLLKDTQRRSGRAFQRVLAHGLLGLREREAARLFMDYSAEEGVDSAGPMVASGPNTALVHHHTGDRIISSGDVVYMDFGGADRESLYRADTTRTFAVGHIPDGLEELYAVVLAANRAAFAAAMPGVPYREIDLAGRRVIGEAGLGAYFPHGLGHGLGLDPHEYPSLGSGSGGTVEAGNVFSVEPGVYLPGRFGVRIEDILYIRPDGPERLTELDHALGVVG